MILVKQNIVYANLAKYLKQPCFTYLLMALIFYYTKMNTVEVDK